MKHLVTLFALLMAVNVNAIEFHDYKDSATAEYPMAQVNNLWKTEAVCIKNGSKIVAVNNNFKSKGYGYRECSQSDKAKRLNKKLGRTIVVLKADLLPKQVIKALQEAKRI